MDGQYPDEQDAKHGMVKGVWDSGAANKQMVERRGRWLRDEKGRGTAETGG